MSKIFSNPCLKLRIEKYCLQSQQFTAYSVLCMHQKQTKEWGDNNDT